MYLSGASPHDPRVAPREYLDLYPLDSIPLPENFLPYHPFDNGELLIRDEYLAAWPREEEDVLKLLRDYYAVITFQDEQYARILNELKDMGEYENTVIIFSSDQGVAVGSHGLIGKQNLYEHSMGVPLIMSGPGLPRGLTCDALTYLIDLYPTLCELAAAAAPPSLEGKSLMPLLMGDADSVRDAVFLGYKKYQRAVRRGDWKLIRYPEVDVTQLFDLSSDPHETKNLVHGPEHAPRIEELMSVLIREQQRFGDTLPLSVPNPRDPEVGLDYFHGPRARLNKILWDLLSGL